VALALYRKYRPATFAEVVGQEHVTTPLMNAVDAGRINHAYLFSGPRGCGKTSSARILARSLNCAQGPTADPCGVCPSCVALAPEGPGSIDVVELVEDEPYVVTVTARGYVKAVAERARATKVASPGERDAVAQVIDTMALSGLLFFSDRGRAYRATVHELPKDRLTAAQNLFQFGDGERVVAVVDRCAGRPRRARLAGERRADALGEGSLVRSRGEVHASTSASSATSCPRTSAVCSPRAGAGRRAATG
jgi:DNA polymerase III delta prime subunit